MVCVAITLLAAAVPFLRAFYRIEIDYNEGWNVYNAATVAAHGRLYPAKYGFTSVNYPMLSFVVMAQLHRFTHEYLFTARMVSLLSLLANGLLVGAIVHRLVSRPHGNGLYPQANRFSPQANHSLFVVPEGNLRYLVRIRFQAVEVLAGLGTRKAPILAGMFVVAMFCANADYYVGMDDPQMLAQVFFLAGLYVYLSRRDSLTALFFTALLFAVGGFIKHNPVDFPLAVLIDLALISRWRAAWFSFCGLGIVAIGLALNIHLGGTHFIDQLLAPRSWSLAKTFEQLRNGLGPILLPVGVAVYMAVRLRNDDIKRITAIFLALSLLLGGYFGGGNGVSVNSLFSVMLAVAMLVGLFAAEGGAGVGRRIASLPAAPVLFAWLLVPLTISGNWNVLAVIRDTSAAEGRFDRQVAAIAAQPGTALCESLLRCYSAGKPYVYDPFNSTRLVKLGKLSQDGIVRSIKDRRYGVIQLDVPLGDDAKIDEVDTALRDRFTPEMLSAIRASYTLSMQDADVAIYLPTTR